MIASSKAEAGVRAAKVGDACVAPPASRNAFASIARIVKTIIGVPDYERYVAHQRNAHPGCELLSREAFMRDRLEARYNRPGSKCC